MSKIVVLLAIYFGLALETGSQITTKKTDSLYSRAIEACVSKQLQEYGKQGPETLLRLKDRIFEKEEPQTTDTQTVSGDTKLEYLTLKELSDRFQRDRSRLKSKEKREFRLPISRVFPMTNEKNTLVVSLLDYWFSYKKNHYTYELEGGCRTYFDFDTEVKRFVISKVELWGV
jgi:hypothetical protein